MFIINFIFKLWYIYIYILIVLLFIINNYNLNLFLIIIIVQLLLIISRKINIRVQRTPKLRGEVKPQHFGSLINWLGVLLASFSGLSFGPKRPISSIDRTWKQIINSYISYNLVSIFYFTDTNLAFKKRILIN